MTHTIKTLSFGAIAAFVFLAGFALFYTAKANPSFFLRGNATSAPFCGTLTATTSPTYMAVGLATSTVTFDTGCNAAQSADSIALLMQFVASSTASILTANIQYSQDNVDWYAIGYAGGSEVNSASSSPSISSVQQLSYQFSSTTINLAAVTSANSATSTRIVRLPTPTRYIRVVYSITGAAGAIWSEFVAKRQGN